ncbi:hypothetical protein HAX54_038812 [Datura stramonium]|uniref:Uncharacterized protein n=1 Tax=Datura stramonium TaxID=4076 RepID=A0ABS8SIP6_DATST|nr:hypothetical protein [Datura stramonium]
MYVVTLFFIPFGILNQSKVLVFELEVKNRGRGQGLGSEVGAKAEVEVRELGRGSKDAQAWELRSGLGGLMSGSWSRSQQEWGQESGVGFQIGVGVGTMQRAGAVLVGARLVSGSGSISGKGI